MTTLVLILAQAQPGTIQPIVLEVLKAAAGAFAGGLATFIFKEWDFVRSLRQYGRYKGIWYGCFKDPNKEQVTTEEWSLSRFGKAKVSRNGKIIFEGQLALRNTKGYVTLDADLGRERLFLVFDQPGPKADPNSLKCVWLGEDDDRKTRAGTGFLSRQTVTPEITAFKNL